MTRWRFIPVLLERVMILALAFLGLRIHSVPVATLTSEENSWPDIKHVRFYLTHFNPLAYNQGKKKKPQSDDPESSDAWYSGTRPYEDWQPSGTAPQAWITYWTPGHLSSSALKHFRFSHSKSSRQVFLSPVGVLRLWSVGHSEPSTNTVLTDQFIRHTCHADHF